MVRPTPIGVNFEEISVKMSEFNLNSFRYSIGWMAFV